MSWPLASTTVHTSAWVRRPAGISLRRRAGANTGAADMESHACITAPLSRLPRQDGHAYCGQIPKWGHTTLQVQLRLSGQSPLWACTAIGSTGEHAILERQQSPETKRKGANGRAEKRRGQTPLNLSPLRVSDPGSAPAKKHDARRAPRDLCKRSLPVSNQSAGVTAPLQLHDGLSPIHMLSSDSHRARRQQPVRQAPPQSFV